MTGIIYPFSGTYNEIAKRREGEKREKPNQKESAYDNRTGNHDRDRGMTSSLREPIWKMNIWK